MRCVPWCQESSNPTLWAQGAPKGWHCLAQPHESPSGQLQDYPQAVEQQPRARTPAALRQHQCNHISKGMAGYPGPMETSLGSLLD